VSNPYYKQHWIDIEPERHAAYDQILGYHPALEPVIRPLELRPGLRVLDVGSGPAHTTMELARRISPSGKVTGVDINAEFIARASARAREAKLPLDFVHSGFPPLPFPDAAFDRVFCKNVLEYVDSASATVIEMARVTAPGGVVVASDSDWDLLTLETGEADRARHERVLAASKSIAIKEPRIGRMLFGLFRAAGLRDVKVQILAGADIVGRALPMLKASFARYAHDSGRIPDDEIAAWLASVQHAIDSGNFFFVLPQFVVSGVKP
jgi:SAM-dependent methyltransferase